MNGLMGDWIATLGIFIGVLLRTILPALRKALEAPPEQPFRWNHRYTMTAVSAILIAVYVTLKAYHQFTPPSDGIIIVFIAALVFGSGLNSLINEATEWIRPPGGTENAPP